MTKHTDSSRSTDSDSSAPASPELTRLSGEQAEERTAREGRLPEIDGYFVESETKWLRLPNGNLIDTEATAAEIVFYSECSRLASRVEELENLVAKHSGSLSSADSASNTEGSSAAKETR